MERRGSDVHTRIPGQLADLALLPKAARCPYHDRLARVVLICALKLNLVLLV